MRFESFTFSPQESSGGTEPEANSEQIVNLPCKFDEHGKVIYPEGIDPHQAVIYLNNEGKWRISTDPKVRENRNQWTGW